MQHLWMLYDVVVVWPGFSTMLGLSMRTSSIFNSQHVVARCNRVAKRVQHAAPNNVVIVWPELANAGLTMLGYVVLRCCYRFAGALNFIFLTTTTITTTTATTTVTTTVTTEMESNNKERQQIRSHNNNNNSNQTSKRTKTTLTCLKTCLIISGSTQWVLSIARKFDSWNCKVTHTVI